MARRLKLTRKQLVDVNYDYLGAFRLRIEVSDPTDSGADPYVFLYNQRPVNPYTHASDADFMAITSPGDLAEYPIGQANENTTYPFFRLDYVELDFRSTAQAEETWLLIMSEINNLLLALNRMDELVVTEEIWVGAAPDSGSSESGSNSESDSV